MYYKINEASMNHRVEMLSCLICIITQVDT